MILSAAKLKQRDLSTIYVISCKYSQKDELPVILTYVSSAIIKVKTMEDFEFSGHYIDTIDDFKELPLKVF